MWGGCRGSRKVPKGFPGASLGDPSCHDNVMMIT